MKAINIFLLLSFSSASGSEHALIGAQKTIEKNYHMFLVGLTLHIPELCGIAFSDNGTFTLTSDLWDMPVIGAYEKNSFLITGKGNTSIFYDEDWEELMAIEYSFRAIVIGLREFFILGKGLREFTFQQDNGTKSENVIFIGLGSGTSTL